MEQGLAMVVIGGETTEAGGTARGKAAGVIFPEAKATLDVRMVN